MDERAHLELNQAPPRGRQHHGPAAPAFAPSRLGHYRLNPALDLGLDAGGGYGLEDAAFGFAGVAGQAHGLPHLHPVQEQQQQQQQHHHATARETRGRRRLQHDAHGQDPFSMLSPAAAAVPAPHPAVARLQEELADDMADDDDDGEGDLDDDDDVNAPGEARLPGALNCKLVPDPPRLGEWREKLFHVDEPIVMTHDEFATYFPHVDNVYSHRSTQKYKRKPFVSHYWDCRMKGRPPGTPKSDDPNKKKRKRLARERDLCDVKIKVTEYFPGATLNLLDLAGPVSSSSAGSAGSPVSAAAAAASSSFRAAAAGAGADGARFWTVQRVNGTGGNGKGDGVAGPHKHSLAKSDEIKKNSVQRWLAAQEKKGRSARRAVAVVVRRPTGAAGATARKHARESNLKLYAGCFCPFSQRVWIALEAKGLPYQYCETDPFKKPRQLLEANPRGLVPAIRAGDWACGESGVILKYLEDLDSSVRLFPTEPRLRANCRYWIDHVNARIVPAFFQALHASGPDAAAEAAERLRGHVGEFADSADEQGPYFLGSELCLVDVHLAPFALRLARLLAPPGPPAAWPGRVSPGARWDRWLDAIERNPHVQATTCSAALYLETVDLLLAGRQPQQDAPPASG